MADHKDHRRERIEGEKEKFSSVSYYQPSTVFIHLYKA